MADGWHMAQHHNTWQLLSGVTVILTGTEEQVRKVLARLISATNDKVPSNLMSATQKKEKIIS